ncbi:MAG: hypothetical protein ACK55Z_30920 [bacterium]
MSSAVVDVRDLSDVNGHLFPRVTKIEVGKHDCAVAVHGLHFSVKDVALFGCDNDGQSNQSQQHRAVVPR